MSDRWFDVLTHNADREPKHYPAEILADGGKNGGQFPRELSGTLYRNGPGIFELDSYRRGTMVDGDGYVQSFRIHDGQVTYRARFVETHRYKADLKAGKFTSQSWSTRLPGGFLKNIGGPRHLGEHGGDHAGVTVWLKNGKLYAFNETSTPWLLDPTDLTTIAKAHPKTLEPLPEPHSETGIPDIKYAAHCKSDPETGQWLHFGLHYWPPKRRRDWESKKDAGWFHCTLDLTIFNRDGRLASYGWYQLRDATYLHDWFFTERYVVFVLHPVRFRLWLWLLGFKSFAGSMAWRPKKGNQVLVFDRNNLTGPLKPIRIFETEAIWMWHAINAYERETGEIVADFMGHEGPGDFVGNDAMLRSVMESRTTAWPDSGVIRYVIDLQKGCLTREVPYWAKQHCDFPMLDPQLAGKPHKIFYFAETDAQSAGYVNALVRFDATTGGRCQYSFGPNEVCMEPVFAKGPSPGSDTDYLLVQSQPLGEDQKSRLHVFRTSDITAGPVATAVLEQSCPFNFHGCWAPD